MALTAKQEKFCQAIVSGMNQSDAYRSAYDAGKMSQQVVQNKASLLMKKGEARVRVEQLRAPVIAKMQAKAVYGIEEAMAEAKDAMAVAKAKENGGAMIAAVTLRAKLNGLIVEKRQNIPNPFDGVPIDELEAADAALTAIKNARRTDKSSAGIPAR